MTKEDLNEVLLRFQREVFLPEFRQLLDEAFDRTFGAAEERILARVREIQTRRPDATQDSALIPQH